MSIGRWMMRASLRLIRLRGWVHRGFKDPGRSTGWLNPERYPAQLHPEIWSVAGHKLLTIHPPEGSGQHLLFLPGGAYLMEPTLIHQWFLRKLVGRLGLPATMLDYPKAPENTYQTTIQVALQAYQEVARRFPAREIILLGDSAGGGLALALAQKLRDMGVQPLPAKTILISPWLDLSLTNQEISHYSTRDPLLPLDGLIYAAGKYSGGEDLKNPLLSPLFGEMHNLGKVLVLFGTEEIFYPDCEALIAKLADAPGSQVESLKGEGMIHDWILFPFRQSRAGLDLMARFIKE